MTNTGKLETKNAAGRWAPIVAAAALLALLSGCVVYPIGYYAPDRPHYWHGR